MKQKILKKLLEIKKLIQIKHIIIATSMVIFIVLCVVLNSTQNKEVIEAPLVNSENIESTEPIVEEVIEESETIEQSYIMVDVKGAVTNPGVYKLLKDSRVIDAVNLSDGLLDTADTSNVNLSKKLNDEDVVTIYTKEEVENMDKKECVCETESTEETSTTVNINLASLETLMTIPGIGEVKATEIIKYRETKSFTKTEDIMNVSGIGESTYNKIKSYIKV